MNAALSRARTVLHALVLLGVMLHALVPAGFMPSFKTDAPMQIEICTAAGFSTVMVGGESHDGNHDQKPECPYAPVLGHMAVTQVMLFAAVLVQDITPTLPPFTLAQFFQKPWLSRGPPLLTQAD